jgi:hypothetical protein
MTERLRPMSLGEILDRSFQIYRSRFFPFVVIAAMPLTAEMALTVAGFVLKALIGQTTLSIIAKNQLNAGIDWFTSRNAASLLYFGTWFVFAVLIAQIVTQGSLNVRSAFKQCLDRWRGWILMSGLLSLIGSELPRQLRTSRFLWRSWSSMPFWLTSILSTIEGFVLIAPLFLGVPAWALEKRPPLNAISRSWTLSRRAYGKIFIAWLLKDVIAHSISLTLGGLIFIIFQLLMISHWNAFSPGRTMFWISLPGYISSILIGPLFPISLTLIYYDQRIRLEGFDIEWMMDASGMTTMPEKAPPMLAAEPEMVEETQG